MHLWRRCSISALVFCWLLQATALMFAQSPVGEDRDGAAIRRLVQKYVDAREQKNAQAVEALFTSDADQLVSSGEWRKGRDQVVRGAMASSERTGGKRTIALESIRYIDSGVAIADGRYVLTGLAGGTTRRMWSTFVLKRTSDGWRIAAIRNMLPAAPAPMK
jgi:uncharacterized protein (TIGR02246 family)